ncbi:MAG: 2TM domain-containing protein [Halobacteriota archaeon]
MENDAELTQMARRRAEAKVAFYTHFAIYVVVNIGLIALWWFTGAGFPWFIFVIIFWGIAIVVQGSRLYIGTGMTERMAERELERLKREKGQ